MSIAAVFALKNTPYGTALHSWPASFSAGLNALSLVNAGAGEFHFPKKITLYSVLNQKNILSNTRI